ncbi:MAG: hypothetical protein Q7N50_02865 [Armatimonadota bacterium]|nr:hypothetical protein [Armatimonadota bacterium]
MDIETINIKTGERTWRDYTPEELTEIIARNASYAAENPPKPPKLTVEGLANMLEIAGVLTKEQIDRAKK